MPDLDCAPIGAQVAGLLHQLEVAKNLFREAQHRLDDEKTRQALAAIRNVLLEIVDLPCFLESRSAPANSASENARIVEVLCFDPLIRMRNEDELVVPCLFREGLYWVPVRKNQYAFADRCPLTDQEILFEIDSFMKAFYFRSLKLSNLSAPADHG